MFGIQSKRLKHRTTDVMLDHLEILCNTHPNDFDRNDASYKMTHTLDEFFVGNPDSKAVMAKR